MYPMNDMNSVFNHYSKEQKRNVPTDNTTGKDAVPPIKNSADDYYKRYPK